MHEYLLNLVPPIVESLYVRTVPELLVPNRKFSQKYLSSDPVVNQMYYLWKITLLFLRKKITILFNKIIVLLK